MTTSVIGFADGSASNPRTDDRDRNEDVRKNMFATGTQNDTEGTETRRGASEEPEEAEEAEVTTTRTTRQTNNRGRKPKRVSYEKVAPYDSNLTFEETETQSP